LDKSAVEEIRVTFQPSGRSDYVLPGTTILEAAGRVGVILQTPCGGQGTCGKCRVRILDGIDLPDRQPWDENGPISREQFDEGYRLACQERIQCPLVIGIPEESTFESRQQILVSDTGEKGNMNPALRKTFFELSPPSREDVRSDLARIHDSIGDDVAISHDLVQTLPEFLRTNDWRGTAVLAGRELIAVEPGDTSQEAFGVAFDIGTTTVVGTLFDLTDGSECDVASEMNAQIAYGDDVISRILKVREEAGALEFLQQAILGTINLILTTLAQRAEVACEKIYEIVIAGNSTMQQIAAGFDPSALGEAPFVQVFDKAQTLPASHLGLRANDRASIYLFPQVGGFVGGDTVAGILAARLDQWDKPVLLVDIGTNGEIVLAHNGTMLAASTAAGPAFEGARITQGMRAIKGAIEKVIVSDDVQVNVIGNVDPTGLCGSALIDVVAELLRIGVIDETGRILSPDEIPDSVPEPVRRRLVETENDVNFMLADSGNSPAVAPVYLWQRDVRELQLATGAIRAGINILLRASGLTPDDVGAVLLAGAFGNFIRRSNARRIGLLPQIPADSIRFIGNAASLGSKLVLLSADERRYATELRHKVKHVDLSMDPEFQMEFGMAMMFPREYAVSGEQSLAAGRRDEQNTNGG